MPLAPYDKEALRKQMEEAKQNMYASFFYEQIPFARKWRYQIDGRNYERKILHLPNPLPTVVMSEHAADMLVTVYTILFTGYTVGEVQAWIDDPAHEEFERFIREAKGL